MRTYQPTGPTTPGLYDRLAKTHRMDVGQVVARLTDLRRPSGVAPGRFGVALHKGGRHPMLNAEKKSVERAMAERFQETAGTSHAKDKVIKRIIVKPESPAAAGVAGTWASHVWEVWSLKYSPGLVLRNHKGQESAVFPGWGKVKATLEKLGFKIIK